MALIYGLPYVTFDSPTPSRYVAIVSSFHVPSSAFRMSRAILECQHISPAIPEVHIVRQVCTNVSAVVPGNDTLPYV